MELAGQTIAVDGDGAFEFDGVSLVTGTNTLVVTATDGLGHVASAALTVTVDLDRPWADVTANPPVFSPGNCADRTAFALQASPPSGEAIAAWRLEVLDGTDVVTATSGVGAPPADVEWDGSGQPEGDYAYTLVVTATNGLSTATPLQTVHIDQTPPSAPTILVPGGPTTVTQWRVWVAGTSEPGSTVTLLDGGYFTTTLTGTVGLDGQWAGYYPLHGGVNAIHAVASDATCVPSPLSEPVTVTLIAQPPLYTVGVTPTTVAAGQQVTLWATARAENPVEGAPTAAVWAWPPDGTQETLTRTQVLAGGAVGLWTETWPAAGLSSGDYPIFFEGIDEDNLSGHGETGLAVRNEPDPPHITWPAGPHYTDDPQVYVRGTVGTGYLTVQLYDGATTQATLSLGPTLYWGTVVTLTGEGPHALYAEAEDRFGQVSAPSDVLTVTLDTTPPSDVSITAEVENDYVVVTWSAHDNDGGSGLDTCTLKVQEPDSSWTELASDCEGTYTYTTAVPGYLHTFRVTATDNVGYVASAEAQAGTSRVTKYYYHGGRRVAMRRSTASGNVVYYLHGDHLGSTSLTTYGSGPQAGEVVARQLYHPYGEVRWQDGTLLTDFGFTGQRHDVTGLIFMHARYYHPALGRFVSADTIVPSAGNPQDLNRYSYVRNRPLNCTDPSGHQCSFNVLTGESSCPAGSTLTVDGNPSGAPVGLVYGPPTPPEIIERQKVEQEAARQARIREIEYKAAIAINAGNLLITGIGGPLAAAYGVAPADANVKGGYGGLYYPPNQVGMAASVDDVPMLWSNSVFEELGDMPPESARAFQAAVNKVNSGDVYVVGGYAKGEHPHGGLDFDVFIMNTKAWTPVWQELLPGPPVPGGYVDPRAGFFGESLPGPWIRFRPFEPPMTGWGVLKRPKE